ncbi:MAG: tetratricopeptide repeat protein, partial [Vulcanimicrobiaceae bacterium]
ASGQYAQAVPYYKRALAANPHNAAAKEGLSQAESALAPGQ